ncbi:MAG TPA: hypothetical protein VFM02_03250 [Candidatus Paceibacterota bacterium]|nr:hypothetical protein [Candidatus Paceibacterota bacterium]
MGAMNKHPSCKKSWPCTTQATYNISKALADIFSANAALERALLSEMDGAVNLSSLHEMCEKARSSYEALQGAREQLDRAIQIGESEKTPYLEGFQKLSANKLGHLWGDSLVPGQRETVIKIASEIKSDHLAPSRRFVRELLKIEDLTNRVLQSFQQVYSLGEKNGLREALEQNKVPLQANFALLMTVWTDFLREYIMDSLIATHVVFEVEGYPSLKVS